MANNPALWNYIHIALFILWVVAEVGVFVCTAAVKNTKLAYEARGRFVKLARKIDFVPRICFALILPVGIELTGAINVYPLSPDLRILFWCGAALWLTLIVASARNEGSPVGTLLGYLEIAFQALAGAGFVVYGLNSLATGSPIDEPWFAAKLAMFGLAFWTVIAINISFRPFYAPFEEIGEEGPTPDREEDVARAVNHSLFYMSVLYGLIAAIALLGRMKPPF